MTSLLNRERLILGTGILALTALAWGYMIHEARALSLTGVCCCAGMKMSGPDLQPWSAASIIPLFLMWTEMMVAMMLPAAAPMILTFAAVNRKRREREQPYISTAIFLAGYLALWAGFSLFAALGQWALHATALLSPMMVSNSHWLAAGLLIAAGIFQWTPLKHACLRHCRSPLAFLLTDWREGNQGAFLMGLKHGLYCTGCCWVLMALLFVVGVMNMWWVAAITVFVLVEKISPRGPWVARLTGLGLLLWGGVAAFR